MPRIFLVCLLASLAASVRAQGLLYRLTEPLTGAPVGSLAGGPLIARISISG
jgi:hypothetical protein